MAQLARPEFTGDEWATGPNVCARMQSIGYEDAEDITSFFKRAAARYGLDRNQVGPNWGIITPWNNMVAMFQPVAPECDTVENMCKHLYDLLHPIAPIAGGPAAQLGVIVQMLTQAQQNAANMQQQGLNQAQTDSANMQAAFGQFSTALTGLPAAIAAAGGGAGAGEGEGEGDGESNGEGD